MKNEEIIEKCAIGLSEDIDGDFYQLFDAKRICELKDEQFIEEQGGWKTEQPTFDCYCLIETTDFPKNCRYIVAEWDNNAKHFYSESNDEPVSYERYKIIHKA